MRSGIARGGQFIRLRRIDIALLSGRGRNDGQPNDVCLAGLVLQCLHIASAVVFANVGAVMVGPFQDHDLTAIVGEVVALAMLSVAGIYRTAALLRTSSITCTDFGLSGASQRNAWAKTGKAIIVIFSCGG